MMRDFTLIIPTYNRAQLLAALLGYLEGEKADCRILVLDSSRPEILAANRARVAASNLDVEFAEFPDGNLVEKWRQGIHKVSTPFCALCADDDLVILGGVRRCLDTLRGNPAASVVQGYSFTFLPRLNGDIELNNIVYFTPSIEEDSPLERLAKLFERYQAPSYGVFRTEALQRTYDLFRPLTKTLLLELLWSALTAIDGHIIRLPDFSYGRSMGPSAAYDHWHPLEWFCKDPDGLFAEYLRYRELLAAAVMRQPDNEQEFDEVHHVLDLIHLRYLAKHAPDAALEFIAEQQMACVQFSEYWPRHEVHLPLYTAAGVRGSTPEIFGEISIQHRARSYLLFPSFYAPAETESPHMDDIIRLIDTLGNYKPTFDGIPEATGQNSSLTGEEDHPSSTSDSGMQPSHI
jgi:glycosyltransferase domain-containing protein